jgi:hypothetical protein
MVSFNIFQTGLGPGKLRGFYFIGPIVSSTDGCATLSKVLALAVIFSIVFFFLFL